MTRVMAGETGKIRETLSLAAKTKAFLASWRCHENALQESGLVYLDHLIDELRGEDETLPLSAIKRQLQQMVPGVKLGAIEHALSIKYPCLSSSAFLRTC